MILRFVVIGQEVIGVLQHLLQLFEALKRLRNHNVDYGDHSVRSTIAQVDWLTLEYQWPEVQTARLSRRLSDRASNPRSIC